MTVRFKKLSDGAKAPVYSSASAAGADLFACIDLPLTFAPGEPVARPHRNRLRASRGNGRTRLRPLRYGDQARSCPRQ